MLRSRLVAASCLAIGLSMSLTQSSATTIVRLSLEQMTQISTEVVLGVCSSVESHWTAEHKQILTYVTLSSAQALKGTTRDEVTFAMLGGRVGEDIMQVVGSPRFEVGDRVVVHLTHMVGPRTPERNADLWLLGLGQGKWSVVRDSKTGVEQAIVATDLARVVEKAGVIPERSMPLDELKERVRALATPGAAR